MRRDVFQAIADPTRREIISLLTNRILTLNGVAENFGISRPAISKHIKILTECGLVTVNQRGRERYCEVQLKPLQEVNLWSQQYKQFWTEKFDDLDKFLANESKSTPKKKKKMKTEPVVVERTYNAPVEVIWQAITNIDKMKQWYFDIKSFKPEVGFEFQFIAGNDNKKFLHLCKITEVQENKKLAYTWKYDGFPGESMVTFELIPEGNGTKLKLTHEGLETFPADNPDFKKENFVTGWNEIIGKSLKQFVENN